MFELYWCFQDYCEEQLSKAFSCYLDVLTISISFDLKNKSQTCLQAYSAAILPRRGVAEVVDAYFLVSE